MAGHRDGGPGCEREFVASVNRWFHVGAGAEIHDVAAGCAEEQLRIEPGFEIGERAQDERALAREVQTRIVTVGLETGNVGEADKPAALAVADGLQERCAGRVCGLAGKSGEGEDVALVALLVVGDGGISDCAGRLKAGGAVTMSRASVGSSMATV